MAEPIQIGVNDDRVMAMLARLGASGADFAKIELQAARALEQRVRQTFRDEADPFGHVWAPLKPATLKRRASKGSASQQILIDSAAMYSSLQVSQSDIGSTISIGEGLPDPRATANQFGNGRAPARPFFPIRADGQADLPGDWANDVLLPIDRAFEELVADV